ncbi:hypothetical protein ARD30_22040 [Bosea thiooxidans]|uniref:Uncharacterized protein n=1 Tax=Bosea thiooxidans TaxID=53254 RepID=A0A0Q3I0D0_9HYPH|nr:hypothetical protein [Bosea thiooxidans]KQK28424.1 hypothetical protein ARD30_22040 [Bosea thiooxidans]
MSKFIGPFFAVALALGAAGCATTPVVTTETVIVAGVGPVEVERLSVRVVSIDRASRSVIVEQRGSRWLVEVPPVFGNLENLREGDMVQINRVEGVIVDVRRPRRGAKPGITYTEAATEPTFQNLPDKYVVRAVTLTARFERFDAETSVVHYTGPFGPRSLTVTDPAVKAGLRKFKRGDLVELSFAEAFHIVLK